MTRRPEQLHRVPTWLLLLIAGIGLILAIATGGDRPADYASPLQHAPVALVLGVAS